MTTNEHRKARSIKYILNFKAPAGTSRGYLHQKEAHFIILEDQGKIGVGECGLLRGLSADDRPDYEAQLKNFCSQWTEFGQLEDTKIYNWPSIRAGFEMAQRDLESENHILYPSDFTNGIESQAINGLIWMGEESFMRQQIDKRLSEGFKVLKMKVGAIDWEEERGLLQKLRNSYASSELELRVDANGAYTPGDALTKKLDFFAELEIHSIEQPIKPGNWQEMAHICSRSPVSIALDEELIGVSESQSKDLMECIRPQYIILKPSFLGGFQASEHWIDLANDFSSGYWATSALESNVGLSAISQWNFTLKNELPSGLGTGSLYTNNFASPLVVAGGKLHYDKTRSWDLEKLG